ncbi:MAG: PIG-L family deacetylase [Gemmatimonadales bacterium]
MRRALLGLFLSLGAVGTGSGQLAPPGTGGVAALAGALEQLGANKRVLVIGAHPDDEDTQLLALLSRGMGAQAAYLSLTRGEGGQNLIGPELGPGLGLIRTEELLAARQLDGARQYFTRAYDFGFSKSAEETFRFWPRDSLLRDVLEVVRRFRPQILVSIFSGTPRDGHGQHQVAGLLAAEAFRLLRDSTWGPVKLYRRSFDTAGATLSIPVGGLDPVLGQSYHQLAMAGRSRHRSQDMGALQRPGPAAIHLALLETRPGGEARGEGGGGGGFWSGVDTVLAGRARYAAVIDTARVRLNPWAPAAIVPYLARAAAELGGAGGGGGGGPADGEQRAILESALAAAAGVAIDGMSDDAIITGGQRLQVEVGVWNAGPTEIRLDGVEITVPAGWSVERLDPLASPVAPGTVATRRFVVAVAPDAPRTVPYFLRRPLAGRGGLYDWTGVPPEWRGLPFEPPPLEARAKVTIAGQPVTLTREVVYRYRHQAIGEIRRPLFVTRQFDLAVAPELLVWPTEAPAPDARRFVVTVTNRVRGPATGRVGFTPPAGWSPVSAESLAFRREDETRSFTVTLAPPSRTRLRPGTYELRAAAVGSDGRKSEGALVVIDYPHIRPRPMARASAAEIRAARIALPPLSRVGYLRGASDRVPEELRAVGVPVAILEPDTLARGDLSRYDAIVVGSRAYETDSALMAHNTRLLDYARAGGLLIVQYQQYAFVEGGFAPYRLTIARPHDRVTDEAAPVALLDSTHAVFHAPNEIGVEDWQGWVQERGLYFAREWDPAYTPLVETHDPGGPPLAGGLLVAPLGRGTYVYTGLSFFRQLPAGVPGAYRLFANLLGLRRTNVP